MKSKAISRENMGEHLDHIRSVINKMADATADTITIEVTAKQKQEIEAILERGEG